MCPLTNRKRPQLETLEDRTLLSVTWTTNRQSPLMGTNVKVSTTPGTVATQQALEVNPRNPLNLVGCSQDAGHPGRIEVDYSTDGGRSWRSTFIDNGQTGQNDGYGAYARVAPTLKFDANGNLFAAYGVQKGTNLLDSATHTWLIVARSSWHANGSVVFDQFTKVDEDY